MTQPAPYNTGGVAPQQKTNTLAIVAIICGFVFFPAGIICGHMALKQIKETGEQGRPLALTGLIVGYVQLAIWVLYIIFVVIIFGVVMSSSTY